MKTLFVLNSGNKKLGKMSAIYRTQDSCPTDCAFYNNGCYATFRGFSNAENHGKEDYGAILVRMKKEIPPNGMLRLQVSGDFKKDDGDVDWEWINICNQLARARPDIGIICYTHMWRIIPRRRFNFPINASCESPADVELAQLRGYDTVMTFTSPDDLDDHKSAIRVIRCPEEDHGVTCAQCRLCSKERRVTIGFTAHGAGKKKASAAMAASRM